MTGFGIYSNIKQGYHGFHRFLQITDDFVEGQRAEELYTWAMIILISLLIIIRIAWWLISKGEK